MSDDDNVLVRDLDSVEVVGQITDLVLGKTGTMTTEDMEVHSFFAQNLRVLNTRKNTLQHCELDEKIQTKIIESICWNSSAYIEMSENSFYVPEGQGTEVSLIKWLQAAEEPVHDYMKQKFSDMILATVPFSSTQKKSIVAVKHPVLIDTVRIYVKGAPELVIPNCLKHYDESGALREIDGATRSYLMDNMLNGLMTTKGLRVIAFSISDMSLSAFEELQERTQNFQAENSFHELDIQNQTFLALVALKDPLRADLKDTLGYAPLSGITLRLISGDHLNTAKAVAVDAGIMTLVEFNKYGNDHAMDA